jgi:superfamily II DNA/RNA helicase
MRDLRRKRGIHTNPWTHFPRLITSIDFLKRDRPLQLFREVVPGHGESLYPRKFDLLIVDEAHNIAPSGSGRYATDSLRTAAIRTLTPHFEHKLFLTATPHNGYQNSFSSLLEMLDNQRFARGVPPDRQQLGAVMVRRLKSELPPHWDGTPRFPPRKLEALEVAYTQAERRAHQALQEYSALRRSAAQNEAERYAAEFVLKLLKKRMFSSPAAFEKTLEKHLRTLSGLDRRVAQRPSVSFLRQKAEQVEEEYAEEEEYEQSTDDAVELATRLFDHLSDQEQSLLNELAEWARRARQRADTKAAALIDWLRDNLQDDGRWTDRRVIIFTEYRATQTWLHELLASAGFGGERLMTIYGGMDSDERERIKAAFQAGPDVSPVRVLLATDAASEGIDLQNHCSRLIHYEIPWNPNRLEQRNGRIDRHGQRAPEVLIYHFVGAGYHTRTGSESTGTGQLEDDLEFLMRAALKVNTIREDLGKVGPVIATQVEEAMLGRRLRLDTDAAERDAGRVKNVLSFERRLREQIERLREQLFETRQELRLTPENIQAVVEIALDVAGQPALRPAQVEGIWPDPTGRRRRWPVFHLPPFTGSWAQCTHGLQHPHTGAIRPIVFDEALAAGRDDVVLVHLNHRMVQMCLRLLRAEVWSSESRKRLSRVTARLVPDNVLDAPAVIAHGRLVVTGADGHRLHEELIAAGGTLREGRFARLNVGETQRALNAALSDDAPDALKTRLAELWPRHSEALMQALEARQRDRAGGLERLLADRAEKEEQNIRSVLEELRRTIQAELHEPEVQQLSLFSDDERDQFSRDVDALRRRIEEIPAEIAQEVEVIRKRFARQEPRLFPVAVTYLVPQRFAREYEGMR